VIVKIVRQILLQYDEVVYGEECSTGITLLEITFSIKVNPILPLTYFTQSASLTRKGTYDTITFPDLSTMCVYMRSGSVPGPDTAFTLQTTFGDRMNYINCTHGGGLDSYELGLQFNLKKTDSVSYDLSGLSWKEHFHPGPY
jgi:hypothetical protein